MNIPLKRLLPLGLLALLILLIICFIGDIGRIQGKLRNNSHAALVDQGCNFAKEDIRFSGRNGVISGKISEADSNFVLETISKVRGVNKVKGDFTIDDTVGCSSRIATTTTPEINNALSPGITTAASAVALAPALTGIINRTAEPVPAIAMSTPACRILSKEEAQALQTELDAITNTLPEERFAVGNLSATPALQNHLASAVSVLSQDDYNNVAVDIVGYTDSALLPAYNECLSSGRANSIKQYLVANGIDANCIGIQAAGNNNAIASSDTADGRRLNRRIEFLVKEIE